MAERLRTVAIIPCYNAGWRCRDVIAQAKKSVDEVVFIDDGSTDDSVEHARKAGANILTHAKNQGKGAALKTGLQYAKQAGFDIFITIDADGQHMPDEIHRLLAMYRLYDHPSFVLGNRFHDAKAMPWHRQLGNRLSSTLISLACRQQIPDSQCGFRLFDRHVLESVGEVSGAAYEFETAFLIEAARKGFAIHHAPITTIYRDPAGPIQSQFKHAKDSWRITKTMFRYLFWRSHP